ncbi:hypothetical protein BD309DRAFT_945763 [Dichomitus squalens]|uniref:Uncharacterized protein n=1 Tax=Dichomitus squalens TaxID=114155 RepID=A0A4Q9P7I3_9APHY|nr:hypothetical protein BD309DRAFT_945763 [Dichomitus squalens]TBU65396.1 hypothetical protein BD310DRAFT_911276 [Dichomitus squalens]
MAGPRIPTAKCNSAGDSTFRRTLLGELRFSKDPVDRGSYTVQARYRQTPAGSNTPGWIQTLYSTAARTLLNHKTPKGRMRTWYVHGLRSLSGTRHAVARLRRKRPNPPSPRYLSIHTYHGSTGAAGQQRGVCAVRHPACVSHGTDVCARVHVPCLAVSQPHTVYGRARRQSCPYYPGAPSPEPASPRPRRRADVKYGRNHTPRARRSRGTPLPQLLQTAAQRVVAVSLPGR